VFCPATSSISDVDGYASWPKTQAGATAVLVNATACAETYRPAGNGLWPSRQCRPDRTWGPVTHGCTPAACDADDNFMNARWPQTLADQPAIGECITENGWEGQATRQCQPNAVWGPVTTFCTAIQPPCPAVNNYQGRTTWPETPAGTTATGTCSPGYTFSPAGPPQRVCSATGEWLSAEVINDCVVRVGGSGGATRILSTSVLDVTDERITISWTANPTADRFQLLYTIDGILFNNVIPPGGGAYFPKEITSASIGGLLEATVYYIQIFAGDEGGFDADFALVEVPTKIRPPAITQNTVVSRNSVTLVWAKGSNHTQAFRVKGRRVQASRDLADEFQTLLENTTATSYTATGLEAGTTYAFRIFAIDSDGNEGNMLEYTVTTAAVVENQGLPPGVIGVDTGVAAGVAVGVVALFVVLVIVFVVNRRLMQSKQRKMLEEYSSQLQMLTLSRGGVLPQTFMGEMTEDALKANLQVPKTHFKGADATLLNTVMEVALPGFLLLDYATDIRAESRITAGGAGTIYRATLLSADAIQRNGGELCAVKEVIDWPSLTDEENAERFQQEVSIMWALSFHSGVVKLLGYTEEPRTIVTRLYPTDLFRYLHVQEDKAPLESHLLLHLCSSMVSAIAAIHSMGIAHRDIKSPNFLMQEPRPGSTFPDPIICDFGLARSSDDDKFDSIKGYSPRYAPPEVLARIHLKNSMHSLEDDKISDVYSLGVVIWETMARQVPWDGVSNEDIELHVRGGARVPQLEVDENDKILVLLNGIVDSMLTQYPDRRPGIMSINSKFAAFIRQLLETEQA